MTKTISIIFIMKITGNRLLIDETISEMWDDYPRTHTSQKSLKTNKITGDNFLLTPQTFFGSLEANHTFKVKIHQNL